MSFLIEDFHKVASDDLTFLFRFGNTIQISEEAFAGVHSYNIQSQALVIMHHIGKLIFAEHAMIHKDAG